ncbi:EamA/RhaT family transporter [Yersinia nurmii]|uniref:EamA-like transporter family n=1 Tax=Yersinia nurmii TaxID=685706 RepID=A0AAW7K1I2_9GAMM|nr:EamA family transporter [Yersinia nurmii]MDN0088978.1 EamA/RhaT family transporter [Yersinia nurmii]CNE22697.1 EamA-like transporter family [Yersinia nurmii]
MSKSFIGIIIGLVFCLISAAFDVYVAYITQSINTMTLVFYCFISSSVLFFAISCYRGLPSLYIKIKSNVDLVFLVNIAVILNWGGLFYALRFLEPAVVGIVSVACGPALTIIFSSYLLSHWLKENDPIEKIEYTISYLVLITVFIMLFNSFTGSSGLTTTSPAQRLIGITSVSLCAIGTVLYTTVSKKMFLYGWHTHEILTVRNIIILLIAIIYLSNNRHLLLIDKYHVVPISMLIIVGHILPVYLIQRTIFYLTPIQVSLVLLTLPIFTLLLQYLDERILISSSSIFSLGFILAMLLFLSVYKLKTTR